ncbi:uncharacterized protein [Cicer arietinum]|uniref:Uncharacterized protein LOC101513253 n=1 Tax=Cicer arietinum TaxID=3827 RepID=A0A1S3E199_CICAR|nr:uncharacterized protein LOC101513253 [Cicer arietinum]
MMEDAYLSAKISVWWDIENCQVPKNFNANSIAQNIASALFNTNFQGPISISAYGDTTRIPFNVQHALSSTGISLNHVPAGVKDAGNNVKILVDMLLWAVDNPAPANYLLISGDRDFSNALHQLRMRRYNILLAQPLRASASLTAAAKIAWLWPTLIAGGPPHFTEPNNNDTLQNQNPSKLGYQPKSSITSNSKIEPESDNNNSIPNPEHSKTSKLFRLAPHEFFSSNDNPAIIPITMDSTTSITCCKLNDSHDLHHNNRQIMLPISSTYDHAPILSAINVLHGSSPIVVRETKEGSKPISRSLTASSKVQFNGNLNQKIHIVRRVKSLPTVSSCEQVQGAVDVIIVTLNTLKNEMIFPTEENITDCIRYGDPKFQTIDVMKALDCAIEQQRVVKRRFGALYLYVVANGNLWKCVNPLGGDSSHFPDPIWVRIKQFLTSSPGRSSILASRCRYEASLILKVLCLGELVLGDVLKILEIIITVKKWILHNHFGWQPITISLTDDN